MFKIERVGDGSDIVFILIGRIETEDLPQIESLLTAERASIVLDLKEVNLVSREAVSFFAHWENGGAVLKNCPAYIREWIARGQS
jgi:anti-anti-sigma regulatory factor